MPESAAAVIDVQPPDAQIVPGAEPAPLAPAAPAPEGEQKPADQAPAPTGEKPATEDPPARANQSRLDRRIDAANRRAGQEKARADFLAAELAKHQPKAAPAVGAPTLEQHNFDPEAYANAKAEFVAAERLKEHQQKQQQDRTQSVAQRITEEWQKTVDEAPDLPEDFHDIVGELQPVSPLVAAVMRAGQKTAYHLAKNPAEARALAVLEPIDQLIAVGRLAAKLESAPAVAKQPSKAPAPITPVSGKASAPSAAISEDDDMKTFIRKRNAQLGRK